MPIASLLFNINNKRGKVNSENKRKNVEDVERVDKLFRDVGEAAEHLKKYEEKMMLH